MGAMTKSKPPQNFAHIINPLKQLIMKTILRLNAKFLYVFCIIVALLIMFAASVSAQQKVVRDSTGNYTLVKDSAKTKASENTGKFFVDAAGKKYPILKGSKGGLYYMRVSKNTGKEYKCYIKE